MESSIIEVKYNTLFIEETVFYFKGALNADHHMSQFNLSNEPDTELSLSSIAFFALSATFQLNSFFKITLANMAYRLILAHLLNYSKLRLKADPYYTIKNSVSLLMKPLYTYDQFHTLFSTSIEKNLFKNYVLYKKINTLIKEFHSELNKSIIKLTFKRSHKQILGIFYGILLRI